MSRIRGRLASAVRLARLIGSNPRLLFDELLYRTQRRRQIRQLRSDFDRIVCSEPDGARLKLPGIDIPSLDRIPDELVPSAKAIIAEAGEVLEHRMSFLGSGPLDYGQEIDWLRDPVTGHRWSTGLHFDIPVTDLDTADDAKRVWEPSRGHQLVTLARASRLDPENAESYVSEMTAQLESWMDANPVGRTINWTNAMEAGIRAANWLTALAIAGPERLPAPTLERVTRCLQRHGRFISCHLEGSPRLRSNHFVGDLLGLSMLGASIGRDPDAEHWIEDSADWFPREVGEQVYEDGCDFEASLPYHGLVLEMFVLIMRSLETSGRQVEPATLERLRSMVKVAVAVRHPDGRTPQFGDNDSGRILPAGFDRGPSLDPVIWVAASALGMDRPLDGIPDPEIAWTFGLDEWHRSVSAPRMSSNLPDRFPHGGLYLLNGGGSHLVADCGDVGQAGNGGHAHNDALAFEWSLDGVPVVVDPGTYAYTSDSKARTEMRSTSVHSTPQIDGIEINPIDPARPFQLDEVAAPAVESFSVGEEQAILVASHRAYERLPEPVRVTRTICMDRRTGSFSVTDHLEGDGHHKVTIPFPLAPEWSATVQEPRRCVLEGPGPSIEVGLDGECVLDFDRYWYSPSFGVREKAARIVVAGSLVLPATLRMEFSRVARK